MIRMFRRKSQRLESLLVEGGMRQLCRSGTEEAAPDNEMLLKSLSQPAKRRDANLAQRSSVNFRVPHIDFG